MPKNSVLKRSENVFDMEKKIGKKIISKNMPPKTSVFQYRLYTSQTQNPEKPLKPKGNPHFRREQEHEEACTHHPLQPTQPGVSQV